MLHFSLSLMNRLNKTESAIFILYSSSVWLLLRYRLFSRNFNIEYNYTHVFRYHSLVCLFHCIILFLNKLIANYTSKLPMINWRICRKMNMSPVILFHYSSTERSRGGGDEVITEYTTTRRVDMHIGAMNPEEAEGYYTQTYGQ